MQAVIPILFLFLMMLQLPFGPVSQEKLKEETSPVKGWRSITHFAVPATRYSKTGDVIKAESLGSCSALFKDIEKTKKDYPVLEMEGIQCGSFRHRNKKRQARCGSQGDGCF